MPSRPELWNIQFGNLVYLFGALLAVAVVYGLVRRLRLWRMGSADDRLRDIPGRFRAFIIKTKIDGLWHQRIIRNRYAGVMHMLIFGGFAMLLIGTSLDAISTHVYHFLEGNVYLMFSLWCDVGGLLVLAGVGMAAYRRYVVRPKKLNNVLDDYLTLAWIAAVCVTGYVVEGLRMAATEIDVHPDWSMWSPVGLIFAEAFRPIGHDAQLALHKTFWWTHMFVAMGGMGYIVLNFTKLGHIVASPLNMFLRTPQTSKGVLKPIEITEESVGALGASKLQDLTWKDLLDLDACEPRCGRLPGDVPGEHDGQVALAEDGHSGAEGAHGGASSVLLSGKKSQEEVPLLAGGVVSQDELWSCTTCGACEEACPVYVEPVKKIIELRRNLVLEQGEIPPTLMAALRSVQDRGHPWKGASASRTDWTEGFEVKNVANDGDAEFLFWVGCTAALQESSMKAALALARLLDAGRCENKHPRARGVVLRPHGEKNR